MKMLSTAWAIRRFTISLFIISEPCQGIMRPAKTPDVYAFVEYTQYHIECSAFILCKCGSTPVVCCLSKSSNLKSKEQFNPCHKEPRKSTSGSNCYCQVSVSLGDGFFRSESMSFLRVNVLLPVDGSCMGRPSNFYDRKKIDFSW